MSETVLTMDDIETAVRLLREAGKPLCPPHIVHPKFRGWEISVEPTDHIARCANLCGWAAYMKPGKVA